MNIFKLCKSYLMKYRFLILLFVILNMVSSCIIIISPYITGNFIDNLIKSANIKTIYNFCKVFSIVNILNLVIVYISSIVYMRAQTNMGHELNRNIISHIQDLSISYSENKNLAYLAQIVNNDSNALIIFCITIIQNIIINIFLLASTLILLLRLNTYTSIAVMVFLILYVVVYYVFRKPLYRVKKAFTESQSKYFSKSYEQFRFLKYIKINSIKKDFIDSLNNVFQDLLKKAMKSQKISGLFAGMDSSIMVFVQVTIYVIGGIQVLNNNFTIGKFTIFLSYFTIMINSVRYFFNLGKTYQDTLVSYDRIVAILKNEKEINGEIKLYDIESINIQDVSFNYKNLNYKLFNNINLEFKKGNIYGILGPNGSGKSSLINLIIGMYINEIDGKIKYNEKNHKEIDMKQIRKDLIAVSMQEPSLINDSIFYNIVLDKTISELNHDKIENLLDMLNFKNYINSLEDGLNSVISENSNNLSGGEKQKISLLSVLYKNPKLMILDEPTSALDKDSTEKLINYLNKIKDDKIIIIITHNELIAKLCDIQYTFSKAENGPCTISEKTKKVYDILEYQPKLKESKLQKNKSSKKQKKNIKIPV